MDQKVRRVIEGYIKEPGEFSLDMDKSWMEYLKDKSEAMPDSDGVVKDMLKNKKELGTSFSQVKPYDNEMPSDMRKDQKDSPPFESTPCYPTQFGYFSTPSLWEDNPYYTEWRKVQEQDFTQDEDEQQPALSLTRKKAHSDIISLELLTKFAVPGDDFFDFVMRNKIAASLDEIVAKDFHYKNDLKLQRSDHCHALWMNKNNPTQFEKGLFVFKVTSPGSKYGAHTVYLQFLRDENKPADRYIDYPVHIGCTCPSFLFSGAQYYAVKDGYMYMPAFKPDLVAPRPQNQFSVSVSQRYPEGKKNPGRGLNSRVCKHILAVFNEIKNTPIEIHYRKYPVTSPPSKIINKNVWKDLMKFEFTEEEVKKRLQSSSPKVPAYFNRESVTPAVIEWFKNVWFPRSDSEKLKSLKEFAMYPERVFFILIEEAYLKRKQNQHISQVLVNEGYDMMASVIQPESEAEPQTIPEYEKNVTKGTGKIDMPKGKVPEDTEEETEKPEDNKPVKPKRDFELSAPKKVKHPERLKRPSTVKPAIK